MRITTFLLDTFNKGISFNLLFINCVALAVSLIIGRRRCLPRTNHGMNFWFIVAITILLYYTFVHYFGSDSICTRRD